MNISLTNIQKATVIRLLFFIYHLLPRFETGLPIISDRITACRAVSGLRCMSSILCLGFICTSVSGVLALSLISFIGDVFRGRFFRTFFSIPVTKCFDPDVFAHPNRRLNVSFECRILHSSYYNNPLHQACLRVRL